MKAIITIGIMAVLWIATLSVSCHDRWDTSLYPTRWIPIEGCQIQINTKWHSEKDLHRLIAKRPSYGN